MEKFKHLEKGSEINNNGKSDSVIVEVNDQIVNANCPQSDILAIETHICGKCTRSFSKYHGLEKHGKLHRDSRDSQKKFQCDKCPNLFSNSKSLTKHKKSHNDENENTIIQVNSQNSEANLSLSDFGDGKDKIAVSEIKNEKIMKSTSDFGDGKDKIAVSEIKNEKIMKSTIVTSIENKQPETLTIETFVCGKCDRSFSKFCLLKKHGKLHKKSSKKKFQCDECPKIFSHNVSLTKHKKTHFHSRKPQESIKCAKSVKIANLNGKSVKESSKKFKCDECPKLFSHDVSLTKHKKIHFHSKKLQENLKCDKPAKIVDLKEEQNTIHQDKMSKCDGCFKLYSNTEMLQSTCEECLNMLLQRDKKRARKQFCCNVCSKSFSRPHYLDVHFKKMHSDIKKFCCNQCFKEFSRYNFLEIHIVKRHSGLTKLECDKCPKAFSKMEYLKIHQKVHNKDSVN